MKDSARQRIRLVPQNLGWLDRLIRFIIGTAIFSTFATALIFFADPVWMSQGSEMPNWVYFTPFLSIYFFLTAILGADPIYGLFHLRSCGNNHRNPCGTFPFEVDAAIGRNPIPKSEFEHSLSASHHEKPGLKNS